MPLLTEQEIVTIGEKHGLLAVVPDAGYKNDALWFDDDLTEYTRAIEAKVIEKIKAQGVAAWASDDGNTVISSDDVNYTPNWTDYYRTPLYKISEGD